MITDALLTVSSAQAVTATASSTDKIDLGSARDVGTGKDLTFDIRVNESATAAGAATVQFQVVTDDDGAGTNLTVLSETDAISKDALVAGASIPMRIPRAGLNTVRQFLYVRYVVATGPLTAGKFTATVVVDEQDPQTSYPSGFSVK